MDDDDLKKIELLNELSAKYLKHLQEITLTSFKEMNELLNPHKNIDIYHLILRKVNFQCLKYAVYGYALRNDKKSLDEDCDDLFTGLSQQILENADEIQEFMTKKYKNGDW